MNILHLNKSSYGGTGQYANRLSNGLNKLGCNSVVVSSETVGSNSDKITKKSQLLSKRIYRSIINRITTDVFYTSYQNFAPNISEYIQWADVIHLHGLNGWLNLYNLDLIGKKVFWTAHDVWSITGGCVVYKDCNNYQKGCIDCPIIKRPFKKLSEIEFERKMNFWTRNRVIPMANSFWTKKKIELSKLVTKHNNYVEVIPPIVDEAFFDKKKVEFDSSRNAKRKIILGFAAKSLTATYKGIEVFINDFYKYVPNVKEKYTFLFLGEGKLDIPYELDAVYLGMLKNTNDIVEFYSRCDIFLSPSLMETFGMTLIEAQAVGIPVVGFNTGGVPEAIEHKKNGYVAEYLNLKSFVKGIDWVEQNLLFNNGKIEEIRNSIKKKFSSSVVTNIQMELYKKYTPSSRNGGGKH